MATRTHRKTEIHATTSLGHRSRVKLFVAPDCLACQEARQILDEAGVRYSTVVVSFSQPDDVSAHSAKPPAGRFDVPRLMIGPHQIGSLDRIRELHQQGKLRKVLDQ